MKKQQPYIYIEYNYSFNAWNLIIAKIDGKKFSAKSIKFLDIIHRPMCYLKYSFSETEFSVFSESCPVEPNS
jgi:hypothetical protein